MTSDNREIEAKFYVLNLKRIEARLQPPPPFRSLPRISNKILGKFLSFYCRLWGRLGGRLVSSRTHETNLRFDTQTGDLQRDGRVLRLRRDDAVHLTYKEDGRLTAGAHDRREIEFTVSDHDLARQFIEALGYEIIFTYEKYRTTWELDGAHIMLDEMPYGNFVEIEGKLDGLKPIAEKLGLNWSAAVPAGYFALFEHMRHAKGLSFSDLSFRNFVGLEITPEDLGVQVADES